MMLEIKSLFNFYAITAIACIKIRLGILGCAARPSPLVVSLQRLGDILAATVLPFSAPALGG